MRWHVGLVTDVVAPVAVLTGKPGTADALAPTTPELTESTFVHARRAPRRP